MEASVAHYQRAIECYPDLAPCLESTIALIQRLGQRDRPGVRSESGHPQVSSARAQSPLASVFDSMGIEQLYVVNLERRPDRMCRVLREMNAQGLKVARIPAVDALESDHARHVMDRFRGRVPGSHCSTASHVSAHDVERWKESLGSGVFGYLLSQAAVLEDAVRNGYRRIAVFDDDVFFTSDAPVRLHRAAAQLPTDWSILLLGASEYADRSSMEFVRARVDGAPGLYHPIPGKTCGSFAVVYDQSVYAELLLAIEAAQAPYDNFALGASYSRHRQRCFVIDPAVCVPDVSESDIRGHSRAQQAHSQRMRWELARYGVFTAPMSIAVIVDGSATLEGAPSLQSQLPGDWLLRIYRCSADGLQPQMPGQPPVRTVGPQAPMAGDAAGCLRHFVDGSCARQVDMVAFWPCGRPLDAFAVQVLLARAMERANSGEGLEGTIDGVAYRLDAPLAPW